MPEVRALTSFDHGGPRKRGATFPVSDHAAKELERAGLVEIIGAKGDPSKAAGGKSSASPAAQASRRGTASKPKNGAKPKLGAA